MATDETRSATSVDIPLIAEGESWITWFIRLADNYTLWAFNPPAALSPAASPTRRLRAQQPDDSSETEDSLRTLRDIEGVRSTLTDKIDELHAESARAVRLLRRSGWSFGRIAAETGISNQRVAQLARTTLGGI